MRTLIVCFSCFGDFLVEGNYSVARNEVLGVVVVVVVVVVAVN